MLAMADAIYEPEEEEEEEEKKQNKFRREKKRAPLGLVRRSHSSC